MTETRWLITECCGVAISANHRFCPQCGYECRIKEDTLIARAILLAKEATNGWACYAKRKAEHENIAHLHREIAELEREMPHKERDATSHVVSAHRQ